MGLIFGKNLLEITDINNNCKICEMPIENDSYISCKRSNYKYHLRCLVDDETHLNDCNSCKKMYIYMNILDNLIK